MTWGLYDRGGTALPPRVFSNGKTQEEAIDEIIEKFDDHRIVLLKGGVGSGKSIIGATVAGALGKGIINVPVKPLQEQYQRDYEGRLNIRINGRSLRIRVLKGRHNFVCKKILGGRVRCSSRMLPCTVPLGTDTPRWKTAMKCRYWSPIYPNVVAPLKKEKTCRITGYDSIGGTQYFHRRAAGCGYYDQNHYYLDADIIVYNSAKWHADTNLYRKPKVDIEIFDEADLFLDSLSLRTVLSSRMISTLVREAGEVKANLYRQNEHELGMEVESRAAEIRQAFDEFLSTRHPNKPYDFDDAVDTLLRSLTNFLKIMGTEFSENLMMKLDDILNYRDITSFFVEGDRMTFFVPEQSLVMKDILEKCTDRLLFMSATLQDLEVIREVYGIDDFGYVEGETRAPGRRYVKRLEREQTVNWQNWQNRRFREQYWQTLSEILKRAKRPTLVQVHSYQYLPENSSYHPIPSRHSLKDGNQEDGIISFKKGEESLLFSTKTDRGIDLPDGACRAIVIMKYPFPSMKDPLFTVMRKRLGDRAFWNYYNDIARREFEQQLGRGLRGPDDWIEVWSPDMRVHQELGGLRAGK